MSKKISRLTFREQTALHEYMKGVLAKTDDGKYWRYKPGLTDRAVSERFLMNVFAVAKFRKENFGPLYNPGGGNGVSPMTAFMQKTNERLEAIERRLGILPKFDGSALDQLNRQ